MTFAAALIAVLLGWIGLAYAATQIENDFWRVGVGAFVFGTMVTALYALGGFR